MIVPCYQPVGHVARHPAHGGGGGSCSVRQAGFTLLEVILAVAIAVGLLMVVLYFYQQAAELRVQLLGESARVAAVRLTMDRLINDLRAAVARPDQGLEFQGDAVSMRFARASLPTFAAWSGARLGRATFAETDLRWVRYSVATTLEGTNPVPAGLTRLEEPVLETRAVATEPVEAGATVNRVVGGLATEAPVAETAATNQAAPESLSEAIRHVRFRYYGESGWVETWTGGGLPRGVEITLSAELVEEVAAGEMPVQEVFRRVVYLPQAGSGSAPAAADDFFTEEMPGEELP